MNNVPPIHCSFVLMAAKQLTLKKAAEAGKIKASIKNVLIVMSVKGQMKLAVG